MATFNSLIGDVRRKLGFPSQAQISDGVISEFLLEAIDELVTELNLSKRGWIVPRFTLHAEAGRDLYPVTQVGDFGRPYMITTIKEGDQNHRTRFIDVVDEPNLVKYFGGGDLGPSGVEHAARAVAPLFFGGQQYLKFAPTPNAAADYLVIYEPSTQRPQARGDQAFRLEEFDGYLSDLGAQVCLPYAGLDDASYKRIERRLEAQVQKGFIRFRRYKATDRQTGNFRTIPFGSGRWNRRR